jgi:hypothetical protein
LVKEDSHADVEAYNVNSRSSRELRGVISVKSMRIKTKPTLLSVTANPFLAR